MPTPTPLCLEHNNQPCLHQRGSFSRRQAVQGEVAAYSTKPLHRHDLSSAVHVNVLTLLLRQGRSLAAAACGCSTAAELPQPAAQMQMHLVMEALMRPSSSSTSVITAGYMSCPKMSTSSWRCPLRSGPPLPGGVPLPPGGPVGFGCMSISALLRRQRLSRVETEEDHPILGD